MGKHSIFRAPFGKMMRWLGGIPINRESPQGLVSQMVEEYNLQEKLVVAIPPSGTRKKRDYWKSGFYWIAHTAQIPVSCGFLDYAKKEAGFGISFVPTGNLIKDMDKIREFYSGIMGKNPEMTTTMKLRDEENGNQASQATR
jgi:1-acyl-sn-glycerol-3-phosphate acyltransferase